jgi:hypothetical protein
MGMDTGLEGRGDGETPKDGSASAMKARADCRISVSA